MIREAVRTVHRQVNTCGGGVGHAAQCNTGPACGGLDTGIGGEEAGLACCDREDGVGEPLVYAVCGGVNLRLRQDVGGEDSHSVLCGE